MSDDPHRLPDEDDELGEPIAALRDFASDDTETKGDFLGRIERRIERRRLTGDLGRLWWEAPVEALIEVFKALFSPSPPAVERLPDPDPEEDESDA